MEICDESEWKREMSWQCRNNITKIGGGKRWEVEKILWFVFQSLSRVWLFATPWTVACQASLSFIISWSLLKHMSIEAIQPSYPLSPSSAPAFSLFQDQGQEAKHNI